MKKRIRNYRREYDQYQGLPLQKKRRAARNAARRKAVKSYGKSALRGKEVDHALGKGDTINKGNLRKVRTRIIGMHANRRKQPIRGKRRGRG